MGDTFCPIQDRCTRYWSGDNKPSNHHVRITVPCKTWLDMSCDMGVQLQIWFNNGEGIACDLTKIQKIKSSKEFHYTP